MESRLSDFAAAGGAPRDAGPEERATRLALMGIILAAFVLRVIYVLEISSSPGFLRPTMDPLYHVQWARAFAAGKAFQPGPFFRAPLYPWFLGVVFLIFGDGLLLPRLIQAAFGAATAGFTYLVGREAFGRAAGLLAALFAAGYWVLIYFDGELVIESLGIPLTLLALWLTMRLARGIAPGKALLAGLAWGTSFLVRPNALALMPLLAGWLMWTARPAWKKGAIAAGALALGTLMPILPVTAYNWFAGGDFVLISTQGGVNFWIGNNPRSDGCTAVVPGTRSDWWGGYYDSIAQAEAAEKRKLKPSEVSDYYTRQAWGFILGQPAKWARLMAWKLRLFWIDWELNNNQPIRDFVRTYGPVTRWLPLGFVFVGPFGLLGLALSLRGGARLFPLHLFLAGYAALVLMFFVCSRYRAPVLPVLMVYGAHACLRLRDMLRGRRWKALAASASALALLIWVVESIPAAVDTSRAPFLQNQAIAASQEGEDARAMELLHQAIGLNPTLMNAQRNLGQLYLRAGNLKEAEKYLREAARQRPEDAAALDLLAGVYLGEDRVDEAIRVAGQSVRKAPAYARGFYNLGEGLRRAGRIAEAREALLKALELDPGSAESALALSRLEAREGHAAKAQRYFGLAISLGGRGEPNATR